MSLEEIMAKAKEAAAFKQESEQKKTIDTEVKSYEESKEQVQAKEARLAQIAERKNIDESKLVEIRKFLGTSSGFAKGKKELKKVMSEAGMDEEEIKPFIETAKSEQGAIVNEKLNQRSQKKELKSEIASLQTEEENLTKDIDEIGSVELSETAQKEVSKKEFEAKYGEDISLQAAQSVGRLADLGKNKYSNGHEIEVPGGNYIDKQQIEDGYIEALSEKIADEIKRVDNDPTYAETQWGSKRDEQGEYSDGTKDMLKETRQNLREALNKSVKITISSAEGKKVLWQNQK